MIVADPSCSRAIASAASVGVSGVGSGASSGVSGASSGTSVDARFDVAADEVLAIVFRHGQTDWNVQNRIQGSTDIPLNDAGRAQAFELARKLAPLGLAAIVTSPLTRAHETAGVVARELGLPVAIDPDLREVWFGGAEGRTREQLIDDHGEDFWARWRSCATEHMGFAFLAGEPKCEARDRAMASLARHCAEAPHRALGFSTHGGILRFLVHAVADVLTAPVPVENCAAYALAWKRPTRAFRYLGRV